MEDLLWLMLIVVFVGVPGAALTVRMVLRPLLQELTSAVKSLKGNTEDRKLEQRVQELEELTSVLQERLVRTMEATQFHEALKAAPDAEAPPQD